MAIPQSLLIMTDATDPAGRSEAFGGSADSEEKGKPIFGVDHESAYSSDGDESVTNAAISAAYEASRNGDPKAYKDAFKGAVLSMVTEEVAKALREMA